LAWLRKAGYTAAVVERWNPHAKVRQDLFGFCDIVGIRSGRTGVLAVQTTTSPNSAARFAKIIANAAAHVWLLAGNEIALHAWAKQGPRGKRKVWQVRQEYITVDMMRVEGAA